MLSSTDEHDVVLFIEAEAAHKQSRRQNATFNGRLFVSYAAWLFKELESMHSQACKKHPLTFNASLLTETPQTKTFPMLAKKVFRNNESLLL